MRRCIFATVFIYGFTAFSMASAPKDAYVTVENCRILTQHIPAKDVTYKSGVDIRGKPVKPADLNPAPDLGLKEKISFRLILDVGSESRADETLPEQFREHPGLEGWINMGLITLKEGRVMLDGKPLDQSQHIALTEFCRNSRNLP